MCGIAGFVEAPDNASLFTRDESIDLVQRMCDVIRHRGPDDEGFHVEDGVAIGMVEEIENIQNVVGGVIETRMRFSYRFPNYTQA